MKRTFLALCLVLALVLGGVGAAAHTLWDQAGAVAFSAQTRQGDPAAAQGLAATQQALCRPGYHTLGRATANLQWDLTFDLGDPAASRAAFSTPGEAAPEANLDAVMPGYTHLQRAQPTTFAHYMMAYANMLKRDVTRLEDCLERMDECPLGAGALATSTYPVDRFQTAGALGFRKPVDNSMDAVSDRDYAIEFLSACSLLMMHLSRFSEELILWCSWEFKFVELDDAYSTGSSIMPQKKNPDVAELVRGKTGRVYGSLITLLTVMKGLPLAYNKDMQEDKECVFDAIDTVELCLPVFTAMLDTLTVRKENMRRAAAGGFINATDCADYLVKKGMPFREAYLIVGRLVSQCIRAGETLDTLSLKDFKAVSKVFDEDVYQALELRTCVNGRKVCGGPAADSVRVQIGHIREFVETRRHG